MGTERLDIILAGTDTGIGKTVTAAALLCAARRAGLDAVPMKPVQTGCPGRPPRAPDLSFCLRMAGLSPSPEDLRRMCPARYRRACSPHLAAALEGGRIRPDRIVRAWQALRDRHEAVLAEGAGGLLVPLGGRRLLLDLLARFEAPILLVAGNRLGAINHTLLSLEALRQRALPVAGFVLCDLPGVATDLLEDNERTLRRLAPAPCLGRLPRVPGLRGGLSPERFQRMTRDPADTVWNALTRRIRTIRNIGKIVAHTTPVRYSRRRMLSSVGRAADS